MLGNPEVAGVTAGFEDGDVILKISLQFQAQGFLFLQPWANSVVTVHLDYSCKMGIIYICSPLMPCKFFIADTMSYHGYLLPLRHSWQVHGITKQASSLSTQAAFRKYATNSQSSHHFFSITEELVALETFLQDHSPEQPKGGDT